MSSVTTQQVQWTNNQPILVGSERGQGALVPENSQLDDLFARAQNSVNSPSVINTIVAEICSMSRNVLQGRQREIVDLFFHTLRSSAYDRHLVTPGSDLEVILDPEIAAAHQNLDVIDSVTGRRIRETVIEALFALRLGQQPERAESAFHTVYYLLDRSGNRLGVFKPAMHVKDAQDDRYGGSEDREAHLAEVANSTLDRWLETKLVPHTELITGDLSAPDQVTPTLGSFQFYIADAPDLDSLLEGENRFDPDHAALTGRLDTEANRQLILRNFQEFALLDLLSANNDHHFKNILVRQVANKTYDLVAIDNANSFPWCHHADLPDYKMKPLHGFKWSTLPQAEQPFSKAMIERIHAFDLGHLIDGLRRDLVHSQAPSSYEHFEGKIVTLCDRCRMLSTLADQGASLRIIAQQILSMSKISRQDSSLVDACA